MRSSRKWTSLAFGGAGLLALLLAGTVRVMGVTVDGGMTPEISVTTVVPPVVQGGTYNATLFTTGGLVPAHLPLVVASNIAAVGTIYPGYAPTITAVKEVLGGNLSVNLKQITGELQSTNAVQFPAGGPNSYVGVVDAALMNFQAARTVTGLIANDVVRTIVVANEYYPPVRSVTGIDEFASFNLNINIRNRHDIDSDDNLIPDATACFNGPFPLILAGEHGKTTVVTSLDGVSRASSCGTSEPVYLQTASGPIEVDVEAPCLADMQAVDSTLNTFKAARLVLTIATTPEGTLDGPSGIAPLTEFTLAPLPAPKNVFVRANILLSTATVARTTPTWTPLPGGQLPGNLQIVVDVSGPGMTAALVPGAQVAGYTYNVSLTQSGENLLAAGSKNGWVETAISLSGPARAATVSSGDNIVEFSSRNASAIFAMSAAPVIDTGEATGGSNGHNGLCFIATAAYGTPLAAQIGSLRTVRDEYLIGNPLGAAFVDSYYRISPPIARAVSESTVLRQAVRMALAPVLAVSGWLLGSPASFAAAAMLLAVFGAAMTARTLRRGLRH